MAGLVLWGIGYAIQDTLFKALVASMLAGGRRNLSFGLFYTGYGTGWLIGSIVVGILYRHSVAGVTAFSVGAQLASIPVFILADRARV